MIVGLDHVQLAAPADSEDAARAFYGRLLGLAEIEKPEALRARGGVWYEVGAQRLHVGIQEPFAPSEKAHPALLVEVDELEPLARRLADAGASVGWDDSIPGTRRFYTKDPWGNRLELIAAS